MTFRPAAGLLAFLVMTVALVSAAAAAPIEVKPDARPVFDRLARHYQSVPGVATTIEMRVKMTGQMAQDTTSTFELRAAPPNHLLLTHTSGELGIDISSTGSEYLVHLPMMHRYTVEPAPSTMTELVKKITMTEGSAGGAEMTLPLMFMAEDPAAALGLHFRTFELLGQERLGNELMDRVRLGGVDLPIDVWVQADGAPWVRQITPDYSNFVAQMKAQGMGDMSIELVVKYKNAEAKQMPVESFVFTPPKTSKKSERLVDAPAAAQANDPRALIGHHAPAIELARLNGESVSLAQHRGTDVVVLDFWATWCGPCKRGLPVVDRVTRQFKDQNVVFYAVNLAEPKPLVETFMKQAKWDFPVLLDEKGLVGRAYRAASIPMTVIIGKDGVVEQIHVGYNREMEAELTGELTKLLSGQCLHEGHHHHGHDHSHDHDHDH